MKLHRMITDFLKFRKLDFDLKCLIGLRVVNKTRGSNLIRLAILRSFPSFHFELMSVGTFEHDPLFSLINYRSRLATPRTNFLLPWFSRARLRLGCKGSPPNKFRLRGAEDRREPLPTIGPGSQRHNEKPQNSPCRSQPEQPFLDPQSPFYLRQREFRISPAHDRKVARFLFSDDSDGHGVVCAAPDLYTVK